MNFWFKYDNFFFLHAQDDISEAIRNVDPYGRLRKIFYYHHIAGTMKNGFKNELQGNRDSIKLLADNDRQIFNQFFNGEDQTERNAFELFAQGLLFDDQLDGSGLPRRPPGTKIHMMDAGIMGYIVWHAFVRAVVILELSNDDSHWLRTDRHIGLAAAIHASLKKSGNAPVQSNDPSRNKPLDQTLKSELRLSWLNLDFDDIDSNIVKLEQ